MDSRTLADRYELLDRIGSGGMGTVWRAHDRMLDRDVAVKLLNEGLANDTVFLKRFWAEARAAAKLTHPNVVAVFDTGEEDGVPYIVMELVEGPSLHKLLAEHGPLPVGEAARIGQAVSGALAHAHERGLVHRDMKPANVLLDDHSREPKVADFGIAKGLEDSAGLTRTGGIIGTAAYISPEQASGYPATPSSDVYAVGCLVYACLAGEPPFTGSTPVAIAMHHVNSQAPPIRSVRPDVPEPFAAVIHRALEKDPVQRFAGAGQMQKAIQATGLGSGGPVDLSEEPTITVQGTAPLPMRTPTEMIPGAAAHMPGSTRAARVLAAISAVLIAAAAVWLTATYLAGREPQELQAPLPTAAPTLEPTVESPSPSPTPTIEPSNGNSQFPLDLPGLGNGRNRDKDKEDDD